VVSSGSIHHVTNLEHLADQINRALTPDGHFFLQDYVGERRFDFSPEKRRLFEIVYERDLARQRGRRSGLIWHDASDLSPFCGVRSDDVLPVLRTTLAPQLVRTAGTLLVPLMRSRPVDADQLLEMAARRHPVLARLRRLRLPGAKRARVQMAKEFWRELITVGDLVADAGLLLPGTAFAVYRKQG
jgi:SAM-dependent methyltransferase